MSGRRAAPATAAAVLRRAHAASSFGEGAPPGPASLDWARAPAPARSFEGCARLALSRPVPRAEVQPDEPRPLDLPGLGTLLGLSLGISQTVAGAHGRPVVRRCVPSAGNLHPLEAYVCAWGLPDLRDGVYHYDVAAHALEQRADATQAQDGVALCVALTLVPWRTSWKYGLRALRGLLLDLGHACAAVRLAAAVAGWETRAAPDCGDEELGRLLGLDRGRDFDGAARERPGALLRLAPRGQPPPPIDAGALAAWSAGLRFHGRAVPREPHARVWPGVEPALLACARPRGARPVGRSAPDPPVTSRRLFERRSACAFGPGPLAGDDFEALLALLDAWGDESSAALVCIRAVEGAPSGLHAPPSARRLAPALSSGLDWSAPGRVALAAGEPGEAMQALALGQPLAGQAALLVLMLARLDDLDDAPWLYRERLMAAGDLGQRLYLLGASRGLAACGLGGFHDGLVARLLGLDGASWLPVYLFALGLAPDATPARAGPVAVR